MNARLLSALLVVGLAGVPLAGAADDGDRGTQVRRTIEEVVVSARKREESAQDTPVSLRAISAEQIERFDMTSLEKIASMSPEFTVGRTFSGTGARMTMRGVSTSHTSIGVEQSVAVIVDEVYYGQGRVINEAMFDMQRVELLKGPQALFFGKNATAGVVSLTTADPGREFELIGRATYEAEAEESTGEVIVSGPLGETLGARLALRASRMEGGYFDNLAKPALNQTTESVIIATTAPGIDPTGETFVEPPGASVYPGSEQLTGRLTLVYDPTERFSLELKASGTDHETDHPGSNGVLYNCPVGGRSQLQPSIRCGEHFEVHANDWAPAIARSFPRANSDGSLGTDYRSWQVTGKAEYVFSHLTLTSVTNYQYNKNRWVGDNDFTDANNGTFATEWSTWDAFSEELRLSSDFQGALNFMAGIFYQRTARDFDQYIRVFGLKNDSADPRNRHVALSKVSETDGETIAPYFQLIWFATPDIELAGGARYTHETKDSWFVQPYVHPDLKGPPGNVWREGEVAAADQTFEKWSPELSASWSITPDIMVYGAFKTAYKSGGFSNGGIFATDGSVADFTFDPETAEGFEGGVKTTLLDGSLRFNATTYFYEYEDLQIDFFNAPSFAFTTVNAGAMETKGIELETSFAPTALPGLTLNAALNYNDAQYKEFIAPCWNGQKSSQGCTTTVPETTNAPGQDISGERPAIAPEWTGALGVSYGLNLPGGMMLELSTNARYSGSYNPSAFANPHARRGSYTTYDASLRLLGHGDRWSVALLGKNLTDEFIVNAQIQGPLSGSGTGTEDGVPSDQVGYVAAPRTLALQLMWRY